MHDLTLTEGVCKREGVDIWCSQLSCEIKLKVPQVLPLIDVVNKQGSFYVKLRFLHLRNSKSPSFKNYVFVRKQLICNHNTNGWKKQHFRNYVV